MSDEIKYEVGGEFRDSVLGTLIGTIVEAPPKKRFILLKTAGGSYGHWDIKTTLYHGGDSFYLPPASPLKEEGSGITSDGGVSDYYKVVLPDWLLVKQKERGFIMLEDLAEVLFDNNFNYTNIFKAQKRMFSLEKGEGKTGNTLEYDATKCKYYIDKQLEIYNRKEED